MDCNSKQKCSGSQTVPAYTGRGQNIQTDASPFMRQGMSKGVVQQEVASGSAGPVMNSNMVSGRVSMICPDMPAPGAAVSSSNIDQYPVAMAYVPWQRWQQVYPVDKAMYRGTIFPDLDKPFSVGRCK